MIEGLYFPTRSTAANRNKADGRSSDFPALSAFIAIIWNKYCRQAGERKEKEKEKDEGEKKKRGRFVIVGWLDRRISKELTEAALMWSRWEEGGRKEEKKKRKEKKERPREGRVCAMSCVTLGCRNTLSTPSGCATILIMNRFLSPARS